MFESGYPFTLVTKNTSELEPNLVCKRLYRFTNRFDVRYMAPVYEYKHKIFALKFHLRLHKKNKNRYNLIANQDPTRFDAARVLRTMIDISAFILHEEPLASFAFIGVHKIKGPNANGKSNKNSNESKEIEQAQRYRVYKRLTEYFLGPVTFKHSYQEKSNAYLLINKGNENYEALTEQVIEMFVNDFQDFGDL